MTEKKYSGAQMVVKSLVDLGVTHIFGYPGGSVLDIYDVLIQQKELQHILVRHEHFGARCNQLCNGDRDSLYGLNSHGGSVWPSRYPLDR